MKKTIVLILVVLSMFVSATACSDEGVLDKDKEYNIIFAGDEFTYYNNSPDLFSEIAASAGYTFNVISVAADVENLSEFSDYLCDAGESFEFKINEDTNFVVLQESYEASCNYDVYSENMTLIKETVEFLSVDPTFFTTQIWGDDFDTIKANTEKVSNENKVAFSPVGSAFEKILQTNPDIKLYDENNNPTPEGSYVIALCHFCTITGEKAASVTYNPVLDPDDIEIFKQAVDSIM